METCVRLLEYTRHTYRKWLLLPLSFSTRIPVAEFWTGALSLFRLTVINSWHFQFWNFTKSIPIVNTSTTQGWPTNLGSCELLKISDVMAIVVGSWGDATLVVERRLMKETCRFASDQYVIDDSLPFVVNNLIAQLFSMVGIFVVLCFVQVSHVSSLGRASGLCAIIF